MKSIGIIPARFGSTRFPGKPLVNIGGKCMIQRVYEQATKSNLTEVIVATDDQRIADVVVGFGGRFCMTDSELQSGTDRCAETLDKIETNADIVINIQGDEPFIDPSTINMLIDSFSNPNAEIATLYTHFAKFEDVESANRVKMVIDKNDSVLYFSRSVIPHQNPQADVSVYKKHIGLYGYKTSVLKQIKKLKISSLEKLEKLEQLRWLQNGFSIYAYSCNDVGIAIDTPEDIVKAEIFLKQNS